MLVSIVAGSLGERGPPGVARALSASVSKACLRVSETATWVPCVNLLPAGTGSAFEVTVWRLGLRAKCVDAYVIGGQLSDCICLGDGCYLS